jgi:hypothetical protein
MIVKRKRPRPFKQKIKTSDLKAWKFIALLNIPDVKRTAVAEYLYGSDHVNQRSLISRKGAGLIKAKPDEIRKVLEFYASLCEEIQDILNAE